MPLIKANSGAPIPGLPHINAAQRAACQNVIAMLTFADLGRGAGTLHNSGVARLDMQGHNAAGDANLQVQIGAFSCSAVIIANTAQHVQDPVNQVGVSNASISVLNQSLDSGTIWHLTGTLP